MRFAIKDPQQTTLEDTLSRPPLEDTFTGLMFVVFVGVLYIYTPSADHTLTPSADHQKTPSADHSDNPQQTTP